MLLANFLAAVQQLDVVFMATRPITLVFEKAGTALSFQQAVISQQLVSISHVPMYPDELPIYCVVVAKLKSEVQDGFRTLIANPEVPRVLWAALGAMATLAALSIL